MHHSKQKGAHFSFEWCIVGYGKVNCGIYEIDLLTYAYATTNQAELIPEELL